MMQHQIDAVLAYLRPHGQAIGDAARGGDALSKRIMDLYTMLSKRPEPVALSLLEDAIEEHRRLTAPRVLGAPKPCCVIIHGDSGECDKPGACGV